MQSWLDPDVADLSANTLLPEQATALTQLADAVLHGGVHLMISAQNEASAERAGAALDAWWRALAPHVEVTHFSSSAPMSWIGHINQMVSRQGLAQAMQIPLTQNRPLEVGVIHDAEKLQASDLELLHNLVAQMPGLAIRWVLLFHAQPGDHPPTNRTSGPETPPPAPWVNWNMNKPLRQGLPPSEGKPGKGPKYRAIRPQMNIERSRWTTPGLVIGLIAVLLVVLYFATVHFDRPIQQATVAPQLPEAPVKVEPLRAEEPVVAAASPPQTKHDEPAPPVIETTEPPKTEAPIPDVAIRGARWLAKLSPKQFVLEHGRFQNAPQAQTVIRARAELKNARVIMLRSNAATDERFAIITGPFKSEERAQNYKVREKLPSQVRVLSVSRVLQNTQTARAAP
jgi:hypothetical protein